MFHYRLVISYKGSRYFGWQELGMEQQKPTVQGSINLVLKKICKYQPCTISAASRTDAGVHAQGQVAKVSIALAIEPEKLMLGMNSLLPADIRILHCSSCSADFNANRESERKEYHYYFSLQTIANPILEDFVCYPSALANNQTSLNIFQMQQACSHFIGKHDFYSFAKRDAKAYSTVRTIYACEIVPAEPFLGAGELYLLKIIGSGFLKQMVRYIMGALFALGRAGITLADIDRALACHQEEKLSAKAKPYGLHLIEIS